MKNKNINMKIKNTIINTTENVSIDNMTFYYKAIEDKILYFQEIIRKTILSTQKYKVLDVITSSELNNCTNNLEKIFFSLMTLLTMVHSKTNLDINSITESLQEVNNELALIIKSFGTESFDDLIKICLGNEYFNTFIHNQELMDKYELISKYSHPIGYKVFFSKNDQKDNDKKTIQKNRIIEDFNIVENAKSLDCFDLSRTSTKSFYTKVYGIKIALQCPEQKKTIIVYSIVDDIMTECLNYTFIGEKLKKLIENKPNDSMFTTFSFDKYLQILTLKELLIFNTDDIYNRFAGYINQVNLIKQKPINQIVTDFIGSDLFIQRNTIIQLLLKSNEHEYQYLSYLLYDLLTTDTNGNIDSQEQTALFNSLPWNVRRLFKDAMKQTIQYTNNLSNFDNNRIPLEQQICLMKASDAVKEKAMIKLKEIKAKAEDSGSKARQYLEGLLRIPFGVYKQEPILNIIQEIKNTFNDLTYKLNKHNVSIPQLNIISQKTDYSSLEISKYSKVLRKDYETILMQNTISNIKDIIDDSNRNVLINHILNVNTIIKKHKLKMHKLCHSGKNTSYMKASLNEFLDTIYNPSSSIYNNDVVFSLGEYFKILKNNSQNDNIMLCINNNLNLIDQKFNSVNAYINNVYSILDNAVHGHEKAKRQVERIIGQWINGEKSGYCFGFEGPPGVGKTSLAKKGIAECLKDDNNVSRPFSFIAIGGSSNGSTLEGHNYTYVGSTWGRIVDILMEKKCMNPIIFIDELDKISKTEHGKEIIGILTHLIDPTQNDTFQDKYFNGIDLDLSKALFIFSYNDVELIDKILLDRIHRIKFDYLTLDDKLTITNKYILPEIYGKMGLNNTICFSNEVIEYIIEEYTFEPGVRKLKEILFEIIGEINLSILKDNIEYELPIVINADDIKHKYLKDRHEIKNKKIHNNNKVGIINGLWANSLGKGGVLPIEAKRMPSTTFLELKLTGMQGDVMKESMNVAKTLAWSLLSSERMKELISEFEQTKMQGVHIHCPEGATPKDGPSAGCAITTAIYSLLTNKKIKNDFAMTGEICLDGNVTAIGGLDLKILGGIRAGVKSFIYPKENDKDFNDFIKKNKDKEILNGIRFIPVERIEQVLELVFE